MKYRAWYIIGLILKHRSTWLYEKIILQGRDNAALADEDREGRTFWKERLVGLSLPAISLVLLLITS